MTGLLLVLERAHKPPAPHSLVGEVKKHSTLINSLQEEIKRARQTIETTQNIMERTKRWRLIKNLRSQASNRAITKAMGVERHDVLHEGTPSGGSRAVGGVSHFVASYWHELNLHASTKLTSTLPGDIN